MADDPTARADREDDADAAAGGEARGIPVASDLRVDRRPICGKIGGCGSRRAGARACGRGLARFAGVLARLLPLFRLFPPLGLLAGVRGFALYGGRFRGRLGF